MKDEYGLNDYHKPSDEFNEKTWILDGAIEDLQVLYTLGQRIAAAEKWPEWKNKSEFKAIREKVLAQK